MPNKLQVLKSKDVNTRWVKANNVQVKHAHLTTYQDLGWVGVTVSI